MASYDKLLNKVEDELEEHVVKHSIHLDSEEKEKAVIYRMLRKICEEIQDAKNLTYAIAGRKQ